MELTNNFMTNSDEFLHVFRNSGKDYNDYGRFDDCKEIHNFNYYMATVLHKFPLPLAFGFCLPFQCQLQDLEDFKPFLLSVLNGVIPNLFEQVKGFSGDAEMLASELVFVDPVKENEVATQFTFGAFMLLSIFAAVTVMVLVSTFVLMQRRKVALESYHRN